MGLGEFSAPVVQQLAQAAVEDGLSDPDLDELSKPSSIKHLQDKVRQVPMKNALSYMVVHMTKPGGGVVQTTQAMLLPHEVFACLYTHHQSAFVEKLCGGDTKNIRSFWSSMKGHPSYPRHPLHTRSNHLDLCIPVSLHGDGVAIAGMGKSWAKSMDAHVLAVEQRQYSLLQLFDFPAVLEVGGASALHEHVGFLFKEACLVFLLALCGCLAIQG